MAKPYDIQVWRTNLSLIILKWVSLLH